MTDSTLANTSASVRAHPYTPPMTRTVLPNISSLPFHHELLDLSSRPHKLTPMQRIPPPAAILPPCATAASSLFWQPRGTTAAGRIELRAHWCVDMRAAGAEAGLGIQLATAEALHAANSTQGEPWHAGFAGGHLARCQHGVDDATGQPKQSWPAKSPLRHPRVPCRSTRAENSVTTTSHATRTASAIVVSSTPAHAQRHSPES